MVGGVMGCGWDVGMVVVVVAGVVEMRARVGSGVSSTPNRLVDISASGRPDEVVSSTAVDSLTPQSAIADRSVGPASTTLARRAKWATWPGLGIANLATCVGRWSCA